MERADERRLDAGLLAGDAEAFGQFYAVSSPMPPSGAS
jgi:hypothetical protein